MTTVYVTAGNTLFRFEAGVRGYHVYRPAVGSADVQPIRP
jgi:hypothetical protein